MSKINFKSRRATIALIVVVGATSYLIGYSMGFSSAVQGITEIASKFITIDYDMVSLAIKSYSTHSCWMS